MRVLVELCEELAAHGTRSVIADAISQMRDSIRSEQAVEHHTLTVFPTVSRAFEALQT